MRTVALIIGVAVGASGCGVAAAKGPGPGPVTIDTRPDCNTGKGGVVADGLGATVLGIVSLGLVAADEGGVAALTGLATVGLIGSAVSGSRSADRCRAAVGEWEGLVMASRDVDLERERERRDARAELAAVTPARPVAPPVPPPPLPPRPVPPRPPAVPSPTPAVADDAEDPDDTSADAAAEPGDWREFWREVTP